MRLESVLPPLRAPSQFPAGTLREFRAQDVFVSEAAAVPQAQPDEMRHLVYENTGELGASAVERDTAFPEERSAVYRPAAIVQAAYGLHGNGKAGERRHTP